MTAPILAFTDVWKVYEQAGRRPRAALRGVGFELPAGAVVAVVGRSGSGKSTLLHLAAGIDRPSRGRVVLAGHDLGTLGERARTLLRRETVGLVFQFFHLLPHLSVRDNVLLPAWIGGGTRRRRHGRDDWTDGRDAGGRGEAVQPAGPEARADDLLARVGLADRAADPVPTLSGGEMQRVAICRALLRRPRLLLADEPTGSLDDETGRAVMDLLLRLAREEGSTLVTVTHSRELAVRADRVWTLHSGELETA